MNRFFIQFLTIPLIAGLVFISASAEEGSRRGEFLFTAGTVARIEEFFNKVETFPYKLNTLISHDFFDFYTTTPGRLLPPKWSQWLPNWSNQAYLDQTLWQWCALIVLPLGVLLIVWCTVRWWYQRKLQGQSLNSELRFHGFSLIHYSSFDPLFFFFFGADFSALAGKR